MTADRAFTLQNATIHAEHVELAEIESTWFCGFSELARHSTQEPQNSQNRTGLLCGFREFCVDRRG